MADSAFVLGTRLDQVSFDEAVRKIEQLAARDEFSLVVTTNPEIIMQAQHDQQLRAIVDSAALSVADGIGVVWASRLLGTPVPERVTGIDLTLALLERAASNELRVYFLGTKPEIIERAADRVREQYPGLKLVGFHHGYFSDEEAPGVVQKIAQAQPDLLFVGMGVPRDQKFLYRWRNQLGPVTGIGVGGSFDVMSGEKGRAPEWVQGLHAEWLYRLLSEPRRLGRQATRLPTFVVRVLRARFF